MSGAARHHPDYEKHPNWTIWMKNHLFHKVVTLVQRMKSTPENLMWIRGFIDALEYEYLQKRAVCDVEEGIGT
jgi:hypothetical protein